eukprot:CAMPEP_0177550488 /NCGR_PEP_ID=MMETSP0369-20130122/65601_1 /TAXON_ID=447022 ORGANISM="Scrippsiella hangoei-like, Strain SHHI-4" /NCGR_SAMPLE_ID=MMETSP0369 /ASSEMBLY_ACC=CAM_ASM_000364 /LENGTH=105 /DNA_ID=CAMNT_0019035697 /DNA_START=177 /DNA_END=492 /DNA_ORIENTATION=-
MSNIFIGPLSEIVDVCQERPELCCTGSAAGRVSRMATYISTSQSVRLAMSARNYLSSVRLEPQSNEQVTILATWNEQLQAIHAVVAQVDDVCPELPCEDQVCSHQ